MSVQAVLLPLFVQVAFTFLLLFWTTVRRTGGTPPEGLRHGGDPRRPKDGARWHPVAEAVGEPLDIAVLFYVLTILVLFTRKADLLFVVMAWLFVLLRLLHAGILLTRNDVPRHDLIGLAAALVLAAMWIIFAVRVVAAL